MALERAHIQRIIEPSEEHIEQCLTVLEAAFMDRTFTNFLVGGDQSRIRAYYRCFLNATLLGGELYAMISESNQIQGVAMWFGPGQEIFSTDEQLNAGFNQFLANSPSNLREWYTNYLLPKYDEIAKSLDGPAINNRWHLQLIAVDPAHRRKGIATSLIREIQEKADATFTPMKLETTHEANVRTTILTLPFFSEGGHSLLFTSTWGSILKGR
ncbi:hypothetical protein HGRIS_010263 [Hohenbuehelia grisea]|uniref:N-acetyltransferase domain-containing protein n=1 Tax=Hohenbuehelia grisea TaxID=104357 RepID=A0ABR3J3R5_9AGAR